MKTTLALTILAAFTFMTMSCSNSSSQAPKKAKELQTAIKDMMPGSIATSADGYTMKAKINGKQWTADSMMPAVAAGRIVGYHNGEYIGLPFDIRDMVVGNKITFGEDNATDLMTNDVVGMWGGRKGEMEITKVDDKYAEGTFYFTGSTSSTNKTMDVTEGFFRVPITK